MNKKGQLGIVEFKYLMVGFIVGFGLGIFVFYVSLLWGLL